MQSDNRIVRWLAQIIADTEIISHATVKIGVALALNADQATGIITAGAGSIADQAGIAERITSAAITELRERCHLERAYRGWRLVVHADRAADL